MMIKKANLEDCKECAELAKIPELLMPNGEFLPLDYFKEFINANQVFLVAKTNKIIGFIIGDSLTGGLELLQYIAVDKNERSKGIGNKLLSAFEEECRKRGKKWLLTYGVEKNKQTINFFEKNNFNKGSLTREFGKVL